MNLKTVFVCLLTLGICGAEPGYTQSQVRGARPGDMLVMVDHGEPSEIGVPFYFQYPLVDHPVYNFLERLETTGEMPLLSNTKPYLGLKRHPHYLQQASVDCPEVLRYSAEGRANMVAIGSRPVGGVPRFGAWNWLRRRFALSGGQKDWFYGDGFHFARGAIDTTLTVTLQPVYGLESINTDDSRGRISRFTSGLRVEGGYARNLHFMMDFRDHTESGNGPYDSRAKLYQDRSAAVGLGPEKTSTSYDISESFLQYYGRDLSVTAGRGRHQWGPAHSGSLFLNSRMPPFDYLRFDAAIESQQSERAVYYTFLHGWLTAADAQGNGLPAGPADTSVTGRLRTLDTPKFISAQRLEVRPRGNLLLGFSQGVVYGDRGVQLGYLTPMNFLYSVQHSNDDKDNLVLGFDGTWRPVCGCKLYGELFLDDVVVRDLLTSSGNNKSAITLGSEFTRQISARLNLDLWTEYTRVRPFVYSHVFATNVYTQWTSPIGYTLEPNSEFVNTELRGTYYPFALTLSLSHENHGANTATRNVGGDIYTPVSDLIKGQDFPLLDGQLQRTLRLGVTLDCEVLPGLRLYTHATSFQIKGLPNRLEWIAGFGWNL
jgi:hypothetical protein